MQQAFVNGGQDILKTFKIDRKSVDIKKFSGVAADWKDWKKVNRPPWRIHREVTTYLQSRRR